MGIILVIIYILVCLFLVMVVLLQQGKGADLAGAFGGGGSQASFGPRSATNIMHRMTTISFVLFVVLSMTLAILSGKSRTSVMEDVQEAEPIAAVEVETGGTDGSVMDTTEEAPAQDLTLEPEAATTGDSENAPENPADEG